MAMAAGLTVATPAAAQNQFNDSYSRSGAFAGASVRLQLGSRENVVPVTRLAVGMTRSSWSDDGRTSHTLGSGLEFGLSRSGSPQAFVGGQPIEDVQRRLGAAPGAATALIIAGVAAAGTAAVVIATSSGGQNKPGPCPPGVEVCIQ